MPNLAQRKEILRIKFTRNISFIEARKLVEAPTPIPGISYANITQSSMKKLSVVDTATQTDLITIVDPAVQSKTTSSSNKTEELRSTTKKSQTKTSIHEKKTEAGLKKCHHGDDQKKKRLEKKKTTAERKTSQKSIITTYKRPNKIKI